MTHSGHTLCPNQVNVAVMRLLFSKVSVDEALRDVENNPILKRAVHLHPPGIFVSPHTNPLGMPSLVLATGVPAGDVDIMHAAVVKWRALRVVSFHRHMA